jgi:hypothetical protein
LRLGDREGPVLEFELALVAGQHDIGRLVYAHGAAAIVAALRSHLPEKLGAERKRGLLAR